MSLSLIDRALDHILIEVAADVLSNSEALNK